MNLPFKMPRGARSLADLDPLPQIPAELAELTLPMLLWALGTGPRLTEDPYADAKRANFDRLIFAKMPLLCSGPGGLLHIERHP